MLTTEARVRGWGNEYLGPESNWWLHPVADTAFIHGSEQFHHTLNFGLADVSRCESLTVGYPVSDLHL